MSASPLDGLGPGLAALLLAACQPNIGSQGGPPVLGTSASDSSSTTEVTTTADDTLDATGEPLPEGPRRRRIELDPALVGDVGGATLLVVLDATRIEYADAQPDGSDLRMRGPGDSGPFYPIQIERWDPEGTSYVWVRIDRAPLPDSIWMYYAEDRSFPAIEPAQVWDAGFAAVWHMELGVGSRVNDSTAGGHDLQPIGFTGDFDVDGLIGPATFFLPPAMPVEAGPLELPDPEALALADGFTIEAWVWSATTLTDATSHVLRKTGAYELHALEPMVTRPRMVLRTVDGSGPHVVETGGSLTANTWTYLAATYGADDGMLAIYRDGQVEASLAIAGDPAGRAVAASEAVVQVGRNLQGILDEVRVSRVARSAEWIRLQHASMTDALMTFGPPEAQP
jgi:biopolymer transport protein ExbB